MIDCITQKVESRFWSKVNIGDGCWEWNAATTWDGYGRFRLNGTQCLAHRISYTMHNKIDPGELLVCHKCDNPKCVNPDHLFLGTNSDNQNDCLKKGRRKAKNGERGVNSSLSDKAACSIREEYADSSITANDLAKKYNVPRLTIQKIINGTIYRTAGGPITRGKNKSKAGENNGRSRLTVESVKELRSLFSQGCTVLDLARMFGIPESTVGNAVSGKTWKHI